MRTCFRCGHDAGHRVSFGCASEVFSDPNYTALRAAGGLTGDVRRHRSRGGYVLTLLPWLF